MATLKNRHRIGLVGFLHETNTFAKTRATYADFVVADAWPGLLEGQAILTETKGKNLPITGFIEAASSDWELVPLLWCSCAPCGPVQAHAFDRIVQQILDHLKNAGPLDALYLDMHGAMVAEHLDDGEGALLAQIRRLIGPDIPIICSLDFHANISDKMARHLTDMAVYRTYPHVDMAATGKRAGRLLDRALAGGRPAMCLHKFTAPIAMTDQYTETGLLKDIMDWLRRLDHGLEGHVEFAPGFPLADVADCGPTIIAYSDTLEQAHALLLTAVQRIVPFCAAPMEKLYSPEDALAAYKALVAPKTVIFADVQDNPGCGGTADTVGIIKMLHVHNVQQCVVGVLCDPDAVQKAIAAGQGAVVTLSLGAKKMPLGEEPLQANFIVKTIASGRFTGTGAFYQGCTFDLGPMISLCIGGMKIVVSSRPQQAADQAMLRHVGIEPAAVKLLVLKSAVHFRADFSEIASHIMLVKSPGAAPADPKDLRYKKAFQSLGSRALYS